MPRTAVAHLLHGFVGAGKTTLARELEARHDAVRFTPDAWMVALFGRDPPAEAFRERASAIEDRLRPLWTRLLALGVDVVLDYGFWSRAGRDAIRGEVTAAGGSPRLYDVAVPEAVAQARIARRNADDPEALLITPATYRSLRSRYEPLQADEAADRRRSA